MGPIGETLTFALRCRDSNGFSTLRQVSIAVNALSSGSSVSLEIDMPVVELGGYATLSWTSSDVSSCSASGAWTGSRAVQGSETIGPIDAANRYTLTCSGIAGSVSSSASVSLVEGPDIELVATPQAVEPGATAKLSWNTDHASQCIADGDWYGPRPLDGSETIASLQTESTFQLNCEGPGGTMSKVVTVGIKSSAKTTLASSSNSGPFGIGSGDAVMVGLMLALGVGSLRRGAGYA